MSRPALADGRFAPIPAVYPEPETARAYRLDEGFWHLRVPLAYAHAPSVNAYLLEQDDGYLLVDCGSSLSPGWAGLEGALAATGVSPGDISLLLTTHHHSDHAGLASEVIARTGCAYAHLDAPPTLTEPLRELDRPVEERRRLALEQGIPAWLTDLWISNHVGGDGATPVPAGDRLLRDGDVLSTRAGDWTVLAAPGHCASQLVLHHPAKGRVISADVVLRVTLPYVEWRHTPDSFGEHLRSIERVRALDPSVLFPGHGRPVDDAEREVAYAHDAATAVRDRVVTLLADGPVTPYELVSRFAGGGANFDYLQLAMSTVLSVLEHLERAGTVVSRAGDDGVRVVEAA